MWLIGLFHPAHKVGRSEELYNTAAHVVYLRCISRHVLLRLILSILDASMTKHDEPQASSESRCLPPFGAIEKMARTTGVDMFFSDVRVRAASLRI